MLIPAAGLLPPGLLIARRRTLRIIAAARMLLPCRLLLTPFFTARCFLALFLAARCPLLGGDTALLQIGPAAMAAISFLKAAHPAQCTAFLVTWIARAVPELTAAAVFTAGFAGPPCLRPVRALCRPGAADIDIHRSIVVVDINVSVPPVEALPKIWDRGAGIIPAAAFAGFLGEG
jgi:hypothetical protein